ncbi:MAG: prepilin-type N-terminal cleavage/methylation domain-containing protein [Desulfobacteraceae bacterium]|nr:prepilin-type N-terminal cleavage/methylation domain-containing protein [Desulfobacteraceae bacterium]
MGQSKEGKKGAIAYVPKLFASNDGFTLIEILVAISILAISLAVILQLFSGGLKSSRLSDEYTRGIFHAREKMGEVLLSKEVSAGETEGEFSDSFRWKCQIELIEGVEEDEEKLPFNMFNIRVDIVWDVGDKEKRFQVSTIKIVEKKKDDITGN